jgi:hypothetical protein
VSIAVEKSIFDNFFPSEEWKSPFDNSSFSKTGIWLRNQESAVVTLWVKNFAQKNHFDNFSAKFLRMDQGRKGSYGEESLRAVVTQ